MPLHLKTFYTRSISALVFVAVMFLGLLGGEFYFYGLVVLIHSGCHLEYIKIIHKIYSKPLTWRFNLLYLGFISLVGGIMYVAFFYYFDSLIRITCLMYLVFGGLFIFYFLNKKPLSYWYAISFGWTYITMALFILFVFFKWSLEYSKAASFFGDEPKVWFNIPLFIFANLWINDTGAYLGGSLFGKTTFSKWSPKKTIEGVTIGIILASISSYFYGFYLMGAAYSNLYLLFFSIIITCFGTIGDLFESFLKRKAHIKDSGYIMPGHGGFLDRFDSLLFSTHFLALIFLFLEFV